MGTAEILGSIGSASTNFDSTLFIPSQSANGLEVNQYDIENDRWGEKLSFDLSDTKDDEGGSYIKIMNGKVIYQFMQQRMGIPFL